MFSNRLYAIGSFFVMLDVTMSIPLGIPAVPSPVAPAPQITPVALPAAPGIGGVATPSVVAVPISTAVNISVPAVLPTIAGYPTTVPVSTSLPAVPPSEGILSTNYAQALENLGTSIVNFFLTALASLAPGAAVSLPAAELHKRYPLNLPVGSVINAQGAASAINGVTPLASTAGNAALASVSPPSVGSTAGGLPSESPSAAASVLGQVTRAASGVTGAVQGATGAMSGLSTFDPLTGIGLAMLAIMCHMLGINPGTALSGDPSPVKRSAEIEEVAKRQLLAAGSLPVGNSAGIDNILGTGPASLSSVVTTRVSRINSATSVVQPFTGTIQHLPSGGSGSPVSAPFSVSNGATQKLPLGGVGGMALPLSGVSQTAGNAGTTISNTAAGLTGPIANTPGIGVSSVGSSINGVIPNIGNVPAVANGVAGGNTGATVGPVTSAASALPVNVGNLEASAGTVSGIIGGATPGKTAEAAGTVANTASDPPNLAAGGLPSNPTITSSSDRAMNGLTTDLPVPVNSGSVRGTAEGLTLDLPASGTAIAPNGLLPVLSSLLANLPASGKPLTSLSSIESKISSAIGSLTAELPGAQLIGPVISLLKVLAATDPYKYGDLANLDSVGNIQQAVQNLQAQPLQLSFVQGLPLPTGSGSIFGVLLSMLDSVDQLLNNGINVQSGMGLLLSKTFGFGI